MTLTGTIQGANGLPAANTTINLAPTQTFFVGGSSPLVVAPLNVQCGTSTDGTVVGIVNPPNGPVTLASYGSGTLSAGNYYVEIAWYDAAGHVTLVSPETPRQLTGTGTLTVQPPASGMPAAAAGMKVYIGASSGAETLQGQTTGSANFIQNTPLTSGAAVPSTNTTVCQVVANDAGWPTGTGYVVSMTGPAGNLLPGYPMQWQLLGPGNTINLGSGLPLYNGQVVYPSPILASPYNHAVQSISGNLSLSNYQINQVGRLGVGTAVPGWGVDAEGAAQGGAINAATGYRVNGAAGSNGQALCSDGSYLDAFCTFITSLPTVYYQTVSANGTAAAQEPKLNLISGSNSTVSCVDNAGATRTDCTIASSAVYVNPNVPTFSCNSGTPVPVTGYNDGAGAVFVTTGCTALKMTFGGAPYPHQMFCATGTEAYTVTVTPQTVTTTGWTTNGTTGTFTNSGTNGLVAGQRVTIVSPTFPIQTYVVQAAGLSTAQFEVATTTGASSATESGVAYSSDYYVTYAPSTGFAGLIDYHCNQ